MSVNTLKEIHLPEGVYSKDQQCLAAPLPQSDNNY